MKCCNLLLILFTIALKCGAEEKPTTVNNFTVDNVTNCDVFNASVTTLGKLSDINSPSEANGFENTLINATDGNDTGVKKIEFSLPISRKLTQQETTIVKSITGSVSKGLIEPNETSAKEDAGVDDEEATTVNYSTVENVTNASTTEVRVLPIYAPDNSSNKWTELPNITSLNESTVSENILINATGTKAVSPFERKEFGKLPIPSRLPQHKGIRTMTNIIGSLMKGLAKLNKPDSDEETDDEEQTFDNYSTDENDTKCIVSSASTTEVIPPNINSSSESPVVENNLINATVSHTVSPFKKKQFGKLSIPRRMPQQRRNRIVTNIKGNLMIMLAQLNEPDSEEDLATNAEPTTVNYSAVDNVTNIEVFNASITEGPEKCSTEPSGAENTLINATNDNAGGPLKKKEFGKLPIPIRLPLQGPRMVKNVIESLVKEFVQGTDSNEDRD